MAEIHECLKIKEITINTASIERAHERLDEHKKLIDRQDENFSILHEMNTNIKLIVQQNGVRDEKVGIIEKDVKEIKDKPKRDWDKVKWTIITLVCTSLMLFVLSKLPEWLTSL